jgi:hypothetical protein
MINNSFSHELIFSINLDRFYFYDRNNKNGISGRTNDSYALIEHIYVEEKLRGIGFAAFMINKLEKELKAHYTKIIFVILSKAKSLKCFTKAKYSYCSYSEISINEGEFLHVIEKTKYLYVLTHEKFIKKLNANNHSHKKAILKKIL